MQPNCNAVGLHMRYSGLHMRCSWNAHGAHMRQAGLHMQRICVAVGLHMRYSSMNRKRIYLQHNDTLMNENFDRDLIHIKTQCFLEQLIRRPSVSSKNQSPGAVGAHMRCSWIAYALQLERICATLGCIIIMRCSCSAHGAHMRSKKNPHGGFEVQIIWSTEMYPVII